MLRALLDVSTPQLCAADVSSRVFHFHIKVRTCVEQLAMEWQRRTIFMRNWPRLSVAPVDAVDVGKGSTKVEFSWANC